MNSRIKTGKEAGGKDDPEQSKRFLEAAREAEADKTKEGADRAFNKVARSKSEKVKK